jgi:hypothetical protein
MQLNQLGKRNQSKNILMIKDHFWLDLKSFQALMMQVVIATCGPPDAFYVSYA